MRHAVRTLSRRIAGKTLFENVFASAWARLAVTALNLLPTCPCVCLLEGWQPVAPEIQRNLNLHRDHDSLNAGQSVTMYLSLITHIVNYVV